MTSIQTAVCCMFSRTIRVWSTSRQPQTSFLFPILLGLFATVSLARFVTTRVCLVTVQAYRKFFERKSYCPRQQQNYHARGLWACELKPRPSLSRVILHRQVRTGCTEYQRDRNSRPNCRVLSQSAYSHAER